jgi:hypothetical protein
MKKRVLYYPLDKRDTTAFWRFLPLRYIAHADFDLFDIADTKIFDWSTFAGYEIFIIQRPFGTEHAQIMQAAKNMGIKVIADYDDLLLDAVDMYNPTHNLYKQHQNTLKSCLSIADEIWASTEQIRQSYSKYCPNIYVIPNAHNDYQFKLKDKRPFGSTKKSVYRGGGSHQADVNAVANQLIEIINSNKDWTFTFMGDRFTFLEMNTGDNYHIIGGLSIMEYFRFLHHENPSVMIFPLCNSLFNRGKSNISWLEGTYAGASFFGNKELPEFNKHCILSIKDLGKQLNDMELLKSKHDESWEMIKDTLLLSEVNKVRTKRILANL